MMRILLIKQVNKKVSMVSFSSLNSRGKGGGGREDLIQNNQNFVVGSKFSSYMGKEVKTFAWDRVVKYVFAKLFLQFIFERKKK